MTDAAVAELPSQPRQQARTPHIKPTQFKLSDHAYARFTATLPVDTPFEAVYDPAFWASVSTQFKAMPGTREADRSGAKIEVHSANHLFWGILYVRAVKDKSLIVQCIGPSVDKNGRAAPIDLQTGLPWMGEKKLEHESFDIKWGGPHGLWKIVRKSDGAVVASKLATKEACQAWLDEMK